MSFITSIWNRVVGSPKTTIAGVGLTGLLYGLIQWLKTQGCDLSHVDWMAGIGMILAFVTDSGKSV